jgi:hypothetical protein
MALGTKTKVGIEKGDLLRSSSFTAIELRTGASETATIYDNVFQGDEIGYFTGKTIQDSKSGITYNEVVSINSLNADGSPNFNGTKYYFDSLMSYKNEANPKYNYSGSGFSLDKALGIGSSILTALGGIFGIINGTKQGTQTTDTNTAIDKASGNQDTQPSWIAQNWLYVVGFFLAALGISGVVYYSRKDKSKA